MDLVFQLRLTEVEAKNVASRPDMVEQLTILMAVTMETAQRTSDKPIRGEIVDDKGNVLQKLP
jgi:hypothetical protein